MHAPIPISRILVIWFIASVAVTIAGPFGTIGIPLELRLPYWLGLMGINTLKWTLWFRIGGRRLGWKPPAMLALALAGVVVINLPLPAEVTLANWAVGSKGGVPYWAVYGSAAAMGLTATIGIIALRWMRQTDRQAAPRTETAAAPPLPDAGAGGLLARAGVMDATQVLAVEAEDHYLRLHLADGRKPLVLYRLRDALAELAALDGEQVHRGYWVAGRAVQGLERRDGRKWALRLQTGLLIPVSATFLPAVKKRGWREMAA